MRSAIILIFTAVLGGCQTAANTVPETSSIPDQQAIELARQAVIAALKDPDSAKFGPAIERRMYNGWFESIDIVCGTINSKNGFGGYSGQTPFAYKIAARQVVFDSHKIPAASLVCAS